MDTCVLTSGGLWSSPLDPKRTDTKQPSAQPSPLLGHCRGSWWKTLLVSERGSQLVVVGSWESHLQDVPRYPPLALCSVDSAKEGAG